MDRTPPAAIRRQLRQEIGFGCPVPGCGNPYLSWHHFDPPWTEKHHQNPEGMIALCLEHHAKADNGAFTKKQLREFKTLGSRFIPQGRFDWMREQLVLVAGTNIFFHPMDIFLVDNEPVIWFTRDTQGYLLLNVCKFPSKENEQLLITENFWIAKGHPTDLECPPSGRKLKVSYPNGDMLNIEFIEINSVEVFTSHYPDFSLEYLFQVVEENQSLVFPFTAVEIMIRSIELGLEVKPDHLVWGAEFVGCSFSGRGISYNSKTHGISVADFTKIRRQKLNKSVELWKSIIRVLG